MRPGSLTSWIALLFFMISLGLVGKIYSQYETLKEYKAFERTLETAFIFKQMGTPIHCVLKAETESKILFSEYITACTSKHKILSIRDSEINHEIMNTFPPDFDYVKWKKTNFPKLD